MTTQKRDSQDVMRVLDEIGAEAEHTDVEARNTLEQAGIDPDAFADAVHSQVRTTLGYGLRPTFEVRSSTFERHLRTVALGVAAASVAFFAVSFHLNYGADVQARRQTAHAQLIGPLLPALASEDAEQRSLALVMARQVDPAFAADTAVQLARWEVSSQAQVRTSRNTVFAARILAGLRKLELSRDSDDRKVAIWNDLLPVLQEARRNREDFVDVAIAYQRVLPLLRVRDPEVFLDSYWGELWILNILLDSKIVPVVEAARQQAPEPAVVDRIFQRNATALPAHERKAFEEAVAVYKTTLKALN